MRATLVVAFAGVAIAAGPAPRAAADTIDGRVVQVQLPARDVTLRYVERKGGFTVELATTDASVEGQKLYIGDGTVAVELVAHPTDGVFLQGEKVRQGDTFKVGSTIMVKPGYKKASALTAGDIHVRLPGVKFVRPAE